jgi:DNA-binding LytR/AlgR family response regulator
MLSAIALDDEPPALHIIEYFCTQTEGLSLQRTFTRSDEALLYLKDHPTELLFLDVNMPAISGIDFHQLIPPQMMVIFTTAYAEYAVEGFNLNAIDYLLKPFTQERFEQAVRKAQAFGQFRQKNTSATVPEYLYVKADYSVYQIPLEDIVYVEGLDDYLKIHAMGIRPVVARLTMKALMQQLPAQDFVRVHRSYIVPLKRIEAVRNKTIFLGSEEIPIGASYETVFWQRYSR